jgi:hypothetical protein
MAGLAMHRELAMVEAGLERGLEQIRSRRQLRMISASEASDLIERAYRRRDAALQELLTASHRHECGECGTVGSAPGHAAWCPLAAAAERMAP